MDQYASMATRHLTIQFLETTHILENSKNVETIQSRIQFLETVVEKLKALCSLPDYQFHIQIGIDDYKVRYINRIPTGDKIEGLLKPTEFDLEDYCLRSLIEGLQRYTNEQMEEIQFLKSKGSKDKRISKIVQIVLSVKNFLHIEYSNSDFLTHGIAEIEKIEKQIKAHHEAI